HLNINPNFNIYSQDIDLEAVLFEAVEHAKKESDLISDLDKKTLSVIHRLKSFLVTPDRCAEVFQDKSFGDRMTIVYAAYEKILTEKNALDFNSLILKAYQLLAKYPVFTKRYRTVYPYICIDEFQDTNHAQYQFIKILTGDQHQNLFIVADDDQIIYQWNGASHKRLEELIHDYSPEIIQLPMNYRCPAEVVELANNLISFNFLRASNKQPLQSVRQSVRDSNIVRLLPCFADFDKEVSAVVKDIKKHHLSEFGSVVILARNRRLLESAASALQTEGIPAVISQRKNEFESTPFVWLHSILRLANDKQNRAYLEAVCGAFGQLAQIEIDPDEVISQAQTSQLGYLQHWLKLVRNLVSDNLTKEIIDKVSYFLVEGRDFQNFSRIAIEWFKKLEVKKQSSTDDPSREVFARFKEELSAWEYLMQEIITALGSEITLEAFLQELQMHSKEAPIKPNTVILMTIHGAKGKEFDHVYIIGLVEDELPSFQSKQKGEKSPEMEEERRNCFVAITRTIKTLTLSYAERYRGWAKQPSRFLCEMGLLKSSK
ncbi:MAG: ATP-dependent helicase, partial [Nitrospirae bacterium]|nr:ATP-dependent helicase [Nitrospirota bacterium]